MRSWVRACVVGELLGFVAPALAGVALVALDAPEPLLVAGLVAAGVVEGLVLGDRQSKALDTLLPDVTGWTRATAIGAGIAWLAGMGGSSLIGAIGPWVLLAMVPVWIVGLLAMPILQRRRLDAAGLEATATWITHSVVGWTIGVAIPVVALSVVPNGAAAGVHVIVAISAAVAMGVVVGLVTLRPLRGFVRQRASTRKPVVMARAHPGRAG